MSEEAMVHATSADIAAPIGHPNIPMLTFWMGRNIEELSHEELLEAFRQLGRELEAARNITRSVIRMNETFERARRLL